LKEEL